MATNRNHRPSVQVNNRLLIGAAVLVGVGGLLGATGMMLGGVAFTSAARQWVRQLDRPPSETAKVMLGRVKAASLAGSEAWRKEAAGSR